MTADKEPIGDDEEKNTPPAPLLEGTGLKRVVTVLTLTKIDGTKEEIRIPTHNGDGKGCAEDDA